MLNDARFLHDSLSHSGVCLFHFVDRLGDIGILSAGAIGAAPTETTQTAPNWGNSMCWNHAWMRAASIGCGPLLTALLWTDGVTAEATASIPAKTLVLSVDQLPDRSFLDVGQLEPGKSLTVLVHLQNDLGKPLSIRSVEADCGCLKVEPERGGSESADPLTLRLELAATRKLGRIRRNVRVFFNQEPASPLDLAVDTEVIGPFRFDTSQVTIDPANRDLRIGGTITSAGVKIVGCQPTRGSCRVLAVEQTGDRFTVRAESLISFGTASELFRVQYVHPDMPETVQVDLPMGLHYATSIRFFPSVASLRLEDGSWHGAARLVTAPDQTLDLQNLKLSISRTDGEPLAPETYRVDLRPISSVLYQLQFRCNPTDPNTDRPVRLTLASPRGEILASLDFSSP